MRILFAALISFICFNSCAQKTMNLSEAKFTETTDDVLKGVEYVKNGNLGNSTDMASYGVNHNKVFHFNGYKPEHVELLFYKGHFSGYSFKISTFEEQQKIEQYFKEHYKNATAQPSPWVTNYNYADAKTTVELRAVIKEKFAEQATGYYSAKAADFAAAFENYLKR